MKLAVSMPPHVKLPASTANINWSKVVVLLPVALISIYVFGLKAIAIIIAAVLSAMLAEAGIQKYVKQDITIKDGDAVLIGLTLALLLPPGVPLWIPVIGAVFAIALVKHAFGGTGMMLFNPAIAAWVFLNMSWWGLMEPTSIPHIGSYTDLLIELGAGRLVDVSPLALIGGLLLIFKRYIEWRIPASFIVALFVMSLLIGENIYYVITGTLMLGIFILATDTATSPITKNGRLIYGSLCGILTVVYGFFSYNYPAGVLFAIFFLNTTSPFIEKSTLPVPIDEVAA